MANIRLGIVGTGWIGHSFAEGCLATGRYEIAAVCSRGVARAAEFGARYGAPLLFGSVDALATSRQVDAVYVASPNALHFEQCCRLLRAGKHVVVEKPAFANEAEARAAFALAKKEGALLFEAARHVYEPNHQRVKNTLPSLGGLRGACLCYMQYSSRYDQLLAGERPNIFTPEYAGGALMDLGVYLVYDAVDWFGAPRAAQYYCTKVPTGVDGAGTALLEYEGFTISLTASKTSAPCLPNEIRGENGALLLDAAHNLSSIRLVGPENESRQLAGPKADNWMRDEAAFFAQVITGARRGDKAALEAYETQKQRTLAVHALLTKLRHSAGILFPADSVED